MSQLQQKIRDKKILERIRDQKRNSNMDMHQNLQRLGIFDPNMKPPDHKMALEHAQAKRVYKFKQQDLSFKRCLCCGLSIDNQEKLSLNCDLKDISHIGSGYTLYFQFYKYNIYALFIFILFHGVFGITASVISKGCRSDCTDEKYIPLNSKKATNIDKCTISDDVFALQNLVGLSIANQRDQPLLLLGQLLIGFVSVLVCMIYFQFVRMRLRKTDILVDNATYTPSDYTLKICNLPTDKSHPLSKDEEIESWIKSWETEEQQLQVEKIIRTYKIDEYLEIVEKRDKVIQKLKDEIDQKKIFKLKQEKVSLQNEMQKLKDSKLEYLNTCFVTLRKAEQARFLEDKLRLSGFKHHLNKLKSKDKAIEVFRAPEPSDIMWENLGQNAWKKSIRRASLFIGCVLILVISIVVVSALETVQRNVFGEDDNSSSSSSSNNSNNNNSNKSPFGSPFVDFLMQNIIVLFIAIYEPVGCIVFEFFSNIMKFTTRTNALASSSVQATLLKFLNNAIVIILGNILTVYYSLDPSPLPRCVNMLANFNEEGGNMIPSMDRMLTSCSESPTPQRSFLNSIKYLNLYGTGKNPGIAHNINVIFLQLFVFNIVFNAIDFGVVVDKYIPRLMYKLFPHRYTQKEAHEIWEGPPFDLYIRYGDLVSVTQVAAFYALSIPMGLFISIVLLFLNYFIDKYIFLRRISLPPSLGSQVQAKMTNQLEWVILYFGIGQYFTFRTLDICSKVIVDCSLSDNAENSYCLYDKYAYILTTSLLIFCLVCHFLIPTTYLNEKLFKLDHDVTETLTYQQAKSLFNSEYDIENPVTRKSALVGLMMNVASGHSVPQPGPNGMRDARRKVTEYIRQGRPTPKTMQNLDNENNNSSDSGNSSGSDTDSQEGASPKGGKFQYYKNDQFEGLAAYAKKRSSTKHATTVGITSLFQGNRKSKLSEIANQLAISKVPERRSSNASSSRKSVGSSAASSQVEIEMKNSIRSRDTSLDDQSKKATQKSNDLLVIDEGETQEEQQE